MSTFTLTAGDTRLAGRVGRRRYQRFLSRMHSGDLQQVWGQENVLQTSQYMAFLYPTTRTELPGDVSSSLGAAFYLRVATATYFLLTLRTQLSIQTINRATQPQPSKGHRVHQYRGSSTSILETKSSVADTTRKRLASDPRVDTRNPVVTASNVKHETTMTDDEEPMKHGGVLNLSMYVHTM